MVAYRAAVLALFFVSGIAALIYQVTWVRQATLVFGVSMYAYSMVLTAFMGGSALGSYVASRWVDRLARPLRVYALLQLGIAGFGLLTPYLLTALMPFYAQLAQALPPDTPLLTPLRLVFSLLVLLPPTLLMGATLPVMARAYAAVRGRVGSDVGQLYTAETLGAALGCALAGLLLIRLWGVQATVLLAVAINLLSAAGAWWLSRHTSPPPIPTDETKLTNRHSHAHSQFTVHYSPFTILLAYALSGFAALGYEVVWTRMLAIFTLNAVFSYTIMLTTFLGGLMLGGWIGATWVRRHRATLPHFGTIQLALSLAALSTLYLFWFVPDRLTVEGISATPTLRTFILFEFLLGALILLLPATLLGVLFPMVVSLYTQEEPGTVGGQLGRITALNTAGAVLGALLTGFVVIPMIGLQKTVVALSLLNLALGVWAFHRYAKGQPSRWVMPGLVAVGALLLIVALPAGYYLGFRADATDQLTFYAEGVETTVAVFEVPEENFKVSFVNGRIEVPTDPISMRAFRLLGHLPAMLHPDAGRALMLSFGNGISTGSLDTHGIPQIDAVDLSAEQFAAAERYWQENYNVLRSAHLRTYVEDGRNFLLRSADLYDIITTDATHPINTSSWALFTQQFYQQVDARLAEGGVFMQWLPFHNLAEGDFKRILRTAQTVFPHTTLWYTGGSHTLLLATREPLTRERLVAAFVAAAQNQIVVDDLGPPATWPRYLAMTASRVRDYAGAGPIFTDDNAFFLPYNGDNERIMAMLAATGSTTP
jgi:spermidine synthase